VPDRHWLLGSSRFSSTHRLPLNTLPPTTHDSRIMGTLFMEGCFSCRSMHIGTRPSSTSYTLLRLRAVARILSMPNLLSKGCNKSGSSDVEVGTATHPKYCRVQQAWGTVFRCRPMIICMQTDRKAILICCTGRDQEAAAID
jgi:hypothetical protein